MTKAFDPMKPCVTKDGRAARVVCTDAKQGQEGTDLIVLVYNWNGAEVVCRYDKNGKGWGLTELVNVPEKHVRWVNVYTSDNVCVMFTDKVLADRDAKHSNRRIACIRIEFEEGQFDT